MSARYDRLAPLVAPQREQAFPGWSVLRDMDGAERDSDAARRARLRFLALRPVLRMAQRGIEQVAIDSFERQIDRVREELGQLPARDAERAVLARLLNDLRTRQPELVVQALLTVAAFAEANGYFAAAAEYGRAARELARTTQRDRLAAEAGRALSRVSLAAGHADEARSLAYEASELALRNDDRGEWIRAIGQLAAAYRGAGENGEGRQALLRALQRARGWGNEALVGLALAQLCRDSVLADNPEDVIEHGWEALTLLSRADDRAEILNLMADAFASLGLTRAAERCYSLISLRAASPVLRSAGLAGTARVAAENGDRERFREWRSATMRELPPSHRLARASAHVELGRAAALLGDGAAAREHAQEALTLLGPSGHSALRSRAEQVFYGLDSEAATSPRPTPSPVSEQVRRIAAELEHVADSVVTLE
jgi:hypothetical protein